MVEYWLPLAFQDPALLHSFLGCAEVHISGYGTIKDGSAGSKHMHAAISMINKQLAAGVENVSHGILAVIAGVALLEVNLEDFISFVSYCPRLIRVERCRSP